VKLTVKNSETGKLIDLASVSMEIKLFPFSRHYYISFLKKQKESVYTKMTWSLTLREEHRLRVFENRVLRRIFGPKRDEVTGDLESWIMRSFITCTLLQGRSYYIQGIDGQTETRILVINIILSIHSSMDLKLFVGPLLQFRNLFYTDGRTPWTGDQPVGKALSTHGTTQTQHKRAQTSMPLIGFEPTIPVFELASTVRALDRAAIVIDRIFFVEYIFP
jgi:hypothetical protein